MSERFRKENVQFDLIDILQKNSYVLSNPIAFSQGNQFVWKDIGY